MNYKVLNTKATYCIWQCHKDSGFPAFLCVNPYQTDIYVKCLQVSVTYLLQYCSITATRSTIS